MNEKELYELYLNENWEDIMTFDKFKKMILNTIKEEEKEKEVLDDEF